MAEFQVLNLKNVQPAKDNYRKTIGKDAMAELTESVKAKGVLQPILVRPMTGKKNKDMFEVVVGSRRHQAALNAGLSEIPAMVRTLTDEEALEVQVIENSQREDPNVMEEAAGFKRLLEMGRHTAESLAEKLGKSVDYVYKRTRLCGLPSEVQSRLISEEISLGHALVIMRLKDPKDQKELLQEIIDEECSVRMAKDMVRDYSDNIETAVFDKSDCQRCEYLSSNQGALFPDLAKLAECTDRDCYRRKTLEHYQTFAQTFEANGFKVFTDEEEAQKYFHASNSCRIKGSVDEHAYYEKPKRYKTDCKKCTEFHAFYFYTEKRSYAADRVEAGELCLNKRCLTMMNNPQAVLPPVQDAAAAGTESAFSLRQKAAECRNRFLRDAMVKKIFPGDGTVDTVTEMSMIHNLRHRLNIYNLLSNYRQDNGRFIGRAEIIQRYMPDYKENRWEGPEHLYRIAMGIPEGDLGSAYRELLAASFSVMPAEVLLLMTTEAGIDMTKELAPDEDWLKGCTKSSLIEYAKAQGLGIEASADAKKGTIVAEILKHDLKGKLTKEFINVIDMREDVEDDKDAFEGLPCDKCTESEDNCGECPHQQTDIKGEAAA